MSQAVWVNKSHPTERVCVTLINATLNQSLNELKDGLPGLSGPPMTKHIFLCWFCVNLSLNTLQENCAQTKCFSSTKGPVVDQMVKSCIKQFGALWLFPPSKTNTEVDSPLIDVKSTNHNWDRSVVGQNNNPHLRSNVVRITWFQVTIERQDLSGFSCPRCPCKAPTCGLCPVLHGRSTEKFVPTLWRTICTISWCGFPCKWTLWNHPQPWKKVLCPLFSPGCSNSWTV